MIPADDRTIRNIRNYNRARQWISAACFLASVVHDDQRDQQDVPYIRHVEAVVGGVADYGTTAKIAAWLHDVVEDSSVTLADLVELGFPLAVIEVVEAVTRVDGETYAEFIDRIAAAGHLARRVKLSDLAHNLDDRRGPRPDHLTERYTKAQLVLSQAELAWMNGLR